MTSAGYEASRAEISVGDLTFSYHEAGRGEPLIMLHGSGPGVSAWSNFQHNLPVFAERFRVIMPDLPGFGRTPLPTIDDVYPRFAAKLVARFMDELGIESAFVIGNSMGGNIAAEFTALYPHRVKRLALMGPGGLAVSMFNSDPSEGGLRLFEFLDDPSRDRMVAWVKTMVSDQSLITDELIDERMRNAGAEGAIERSRKIFASIFDPQFTAQHTPLWSRFAQITAPTLMIWGMDDRMLPYDQAHFANRWLPDVELHTFSRCGHWAQIERKQDFERVVVEFLTR